MAHINGQEVNDAIIVRNTGGGEIPDGAVTTAKIANGAVTAEKIAAGVIPDTGHNYSTTEQVIGTWIDGKPLYEKTLEFDNTAITATEASSSAFHNVENFEFGFVTLVLCQYGTGASWHNATCGVAQYTSRFAVGTEKIYIPYGETFSAVSGRKFIITIQYTKTTDTAAE